MAKTTRSDNVFLLTLVDFLLQVIFVGLFAYAVVTAINIKRDAAVMPIANQLIGMSEAQLHKLIKTVATTKDIDRALEDQRDLNTLLSKQGVSNFVELDDKLSRMVSVDQLTDVKQVQAVIKAAGGVETAKTAINHYLNGVGKPHCLYAEDKKNALPLATITAYDDHMVIEKTTPELNKVLAEIGEPQDQITDLKLPDFIRVFSKLASHYPNCLHSVRFRERTDLVYARNALSATRSLRPIFVP